LNNDIETNTKTNEKKYKRYNGEWKFYNEQGTLIKIEIYSDGKEAGGFEILRRKRKFN